LEIWAYFGWLGDPWIWKDVYNLRQGKEGKIVGKMV
jgi:hypothetical protein